MSVSREITDLTNNTQIKAKAFIGACKACGIDVLIYCTYRSNKDQAELYAQGRTRPGKIVTWSKPGESWHEYRVAFDAVPIVDGKAIFNPTTKLEKTLIATMGSCGEKVGLVWGGRWAQKTDSFHFQNNQGKTISQVLSGVKLE